MLNRGKGEMKKYRYMATILSLVLAVGLTACAQSGNEDVETASVYKVEDVVLDEDDSGEMLQVGDGEETITVHAGADGVFRSATISRSGDDMEEETDISDIPFSMDISYFLDGEEVTADELAGASGSLRIRFDYRNDSETTVNVDGKEISTIVPFAFITVVLLPQDRFSNVEVTNGGVSSLGDDTAAYGLAIPGLEEQLNLQAVRDELKAVGDKLDEDETENEETDEDETLFADYVEITADTVNCKIEFSATIVTNGLFKDAEDEDIDEIDDAIKSLWDFGGVGGDLADGVNELYDGALEFGDGLDSYVSGVGSLADGASQLAQGADALSSQGQTLNDGAASLAEGLAALESQIAQISGTVPGMEELAGYVSQMAAGASQLQSGVEAYTGAVSQVSEGASSLSNGASQLSEAGWELSDGYWQLADGIGELKDGVIEIRDKVFWNVSSLSVGALPETIKEIKALKKADEDYAQRRFIIETDEIS